MADGDTWTLSVLDADSGEKLFVHAESVTYERFEVCEQHCVSTRIDVETSAADAAIDQ